jgi:hypothetical protein
MKLTDLPLAQRDGTRVTQGRLAGRVFAANDQIASVQWDGMHRLSVVSVHHLLIEN